MTKRNAWEHVDLAELSFIGAGRTAKNGTRCRGVSL